MEAELEAKFRDASGEGLLGDDDDDDDDEGCETELMALVVVDEFPIEAGHLAQRSGRFAQASRPHQTINKILEDNEDEANAQYIWLADSYDTMPDSNHPWIVEGTHAPISDDWRSPFTGHSLRQVAAFVRNAPSPPEPIDKQYCAVLRREDCERNSITICKIPPEGDDSEPQTIVTDPERLGMFFIGFNSSSWDVTYVNGER